MATETSPKWKHYHNLTITAQPMNIHIESCSVIVDFLFQRNICKIPVADREFTFVSDVLSVKTAKKKIG